MNLKLLTQNKKIKSLLVKKIAYFGSELVSIASSSEVTKNECCKLSFSQLEQVPYVVIVARQHYQETWKTYSALSSKELKAILNIQKQSTPGLKIVQKVIANKEQDGFDVKTIEFNEDISKQLPSNVVLMPETELLKNYISEHDKIVLDIETPSGDMYWSYSSHKTNSAFKKGMLNNALSFMQSVGLPFDTQVIKVPKEDYAEVLYELVEVAPIHELLSISSINLSTLVNKSQLHWLYLAPVISATILISSVSGYLYIKSAMLDSQIEETNTEAFALISKKNEIDSAEKTIQLVNEEFSKIKITHEVWQLVHHAVESGMEISRFKRYEKGVELRGKADKASYILSELDKLPQVSDATFVDAIRKSRGKELFTILLQVNDYKVKAPDEV